MLQSGFPIGGFQSGPMKELELSGGGRVELRVWKSGRLAVKASQRLALVQGDMIGLIALDLVLRIVLARMMDIAFVIRVPRVHPYDAAADPTSFGIPGYVVADFECPCHELMLFHPMCSRCRDRLEMSAEKASFCG